MRLYRISALIERDMRKFFRNPALMMASMIFPLVQLVVLGYAFGGKITNVQVALVDEDHGTKALDVRERLNAIVQYPKTFRLADYTDLPEAMIDLRAGFVKAVIYIPPDYSQRVLRSENPRIAFIEDNTDTFTSSGIFERMQQLQTELNGPVLPPIARGESLAANSAGVFSPNRLAGDHRDSDRGGLSLYRIHQVLAGGLDLAGDFRHRHDRRRHYFHRR